MENLILVITINIFLGTIIWAGIKHFNKMDRIEEARERAFTQYRKGNGRFSRPASEKIQTTSIRRIKVNDYNQSYFI